LVSPPTSPSLSLYLTLDGLEFLYSLSLLVIEYPSSNYRLNF